MAILNKTVEIKGSDARISALQVFPQPDGKIAIVANGMTKDSEGRPLALKEAQIVFQPGPNDLVSQLLGHGLDALRKVNGFEDAAIALEPKIDPPKVDVPPLTVPPKG